MWPPAAATPAGAAAARRRDAGAAAAACSLLAASSGDEAPSRARQRWQRCCPQMTTAQWNPAERYRFDRQGYIKLSGALSASEVEELLALAQGNLPAGSSSDGDDDDKFTSIVPHCVSWGAACTRLVDHPAVVPVLESVLGPGFRLDHDYGIRMDWDGSELGTTRHTSQLHGGVGAVHVTVVWELSTVLPGEGGFACIPGTHSLTAAHRAALPHSRFPPWDDDSGVTYVTCEAGDCIIFTEELTHATAPYRGCNGRTTLFLKYCPRFLHHKGSDELYQDESHYPWGLTEQQRRIMRPVDEVLPFHPRGTRPSPSLPMQQLPTLGGATVAQL